jgi:uncharacterized DUF497 family protein
MRDWSRAETEWDDDNEEHILRHGVYPEEVEQVLANKPFTRRGKGVYYVFGQDDAGRYLYIVCLVRGSRVRVVTARTMTRDERRDYERHR